VKVLITMLIALALVVGLATQSAMAQDGAATPDENGMITVAAGQTVTIPAQLWCIDYGKPFPAAVTGPADRAPEGVLRVMAAADELNAVESDPLQVQMAIFRAVLGEWPQEATDRDLAEEIFDNSTNATLPEGQSLLEAAQGGALTVEVQNLQGNELEQGQQPYFGTGNLVVTNNSNEAVTFFVQGAVFEPVNAEEQRLVAQLESRPVAAAQTTPTAAATPMAATTPTVAATPAVVATPTVVVTPTVVATPTLAATPVADVVTTPEAVTPTVTPAVLPVTGGGTSTGLVLALGLLGTLALVVGLGLGRRTAGRRA
jgi:hypothetical protein